MPVYVDGLLKYGWRIRGRHVQSCHMIADTLDELLAMGDRIRLSVEWLQHKGPHFDLTASKRKAAIEAGAIALGRHSFAEKYMDLQKRKEHQGERE